MRIRPPAAVRSWWAGKSTAERRVLGMVAALVLAGVGWVALWQPLARGVGRMEGERMRTAQELAIARRNAEDITRLARTSLPPPVDARAALEQSLVRAGLRPAVTQLEWQERRASVTFGAVSFAALTAWLEALQRDAGIRVLEATLSARVEPGTVRAELVLAQ